MNKPTREQILAEPAGRQMDAWVAEFVMEWEVTSDKLFAFDKSALQKGYYMLGQHADLAFVETFMPSTSITNAMQVIEKTCQHKNFAWHIESQGNGSLLSWWVLYFGNDNPELPEEIQDYIGEDKSLPLAICRAALLAVLD